MLTPVVIIVVLSVVLIATYGLPTDRNGALIWCGSIALILSWQQPRRRLLTLIVDWVPIIALLTAYDACRGVADNIGVGTSYALAPKMDHWLTGTIPTVWLQRHLYAHGTNHWWNVLLSATWLTHFIVSYMVLSILWARSRPQFKRYAHRFLLITFIGLVLYVLHPAAPPWLASQDGYIPAVQRTVFDGLATAHMHGASAAIKSEAASLNEVAAFPSLHAAYTLLPAIFFWQNARWWGRLLIGFYPVAMGFTLVATGEHWATDILAGWLLTAVCCTIVSAVERRRGQRFEPGMGSGDPAVAIEAQQDMDSANIPTVTAQVRIPDLARAHVVASEPDPAG